MDSIGEPRETTRRVVTKNIGSIVTVDCDFATNSCYTSNFDVYAECIIKTKQIKADNRG